MYKSTISREEFAKSIGKFLRDIFFRHALRVCSFDLRARICGRLGPSDFWGVHELNHEEFASKFAVSQQLDVSMNLLYGVLIIVREITRDTKQPWRRPIDVLRNRLTELL